MWIASLHHSKSLNSLWQHQTNSKKLLLILTLAQNALYQKLSIVFIRAIKLKQLPWLIQSSKEAVMRILKTLCALVLPISVSLL